MDKKDRRSVLKSFESVKCCLSISCLHMDRQTYPLSQLEWVQITLWVGLVKDGKAVCVYSLYRSALLNSVHFPFLQTHPDISLPISLTMLVLDFGRENNPTQQAALPCPNKATLRLLFHLVSHLLCSHGVGLVTSNK